MSFNSLLCLFVLALSAALVVLTELCPGIVMEKVNSQGCSPVLFWSCNGRYYDGVAICSISRKLHGMTKRLPLETPSCSREESSYGSVLIPVLAARSLPKSPAHSCNGCK